MRNLMLTKNLVKNLDKKMLFIAYDYSKTKQAICSI